MNSADQPGQARCPFGGDIKPQAAAPAQDAQAGAAAATAESPESLIKPGSFGEIVAHSAWGFHVELSPAWKHRDWMDQTAGRFAYHCLPMTVASQSGWFVLAPHACRAEWNGGMLPSDIRIQIPEIGKPGGPPQHTPPEPPVMQAMSAVGHGIMTWTIPYVFRTPPGWNLLCRGPANMPKDGVFPLEGLVETDWTMASFSMNWKFTRPGVVTWEKDEPVAMLVPQQRGEMEGFTCRRTTLASNPVMEKGYNVWIHSRQDFLKKQRERDEEAIKKRFQKHYFHGDSVHGDEKFEDHQKRRKLSDFVGP